MIIKGAKHEVQFYVEDHTDEAEKVWDQLRKEYGEHDFNWGIQKDPCGENGLVLVTITWWKGQQF